MSAAANTTAIPDDVAGRLVRSAYTALDIFGGRELSLLTWSRAVDPAADASRIVPDYFDDPSGGILLTALAEAEVLRDDATIDPLRLRQFQETVELLPHFRRAEFVRRPAPTAQVVFTFPPEAKLPVQAAHLQRSLAVRVGDALRSATERVLLASPYWSDIGTAQLRPSLDRCVAAGIPITIAGARAKAEDENYDHLAAMLRFAEALRGDGAAVAGPPLTPPETNPRCIFHAKLVCGATGYLGSGNMTDAARTQRRSRRPPRPRGRRRAGLVDGRTAARSGPAS